MKLGTVKNKTIPAVSNNRTAHKLIKPATFATFLILRSGKTNPATKAIKATSEKIQDTKAAPDTFPSNVPLLITYVILLGIFILVSFEHPLNAFGPKAFTVLGITVFWQPYNNKSLQQ